MKTYARIHDGLVAELFATDQDITQMFNSALKWVDVTAVPGILQGWSFDGSGFSPPVKPIASPPPPTIAQLQMQVNALAAQVAALTKAV